MGWVGIGGRSSSGLADRAIERLWGCALGGCNGKLKPATTVRCDHAGRAKQGTSGSGNGS